MEIKYYQPHKQKINEKKCRIPFFFYTYNKLIKSISTIVYYSLGAAASIAISCSMMLMPKLTNGVNTLGFSNFYGIWFIVSTGLILLFTAIKTVQTFRDEIDDGTMLILVSKPYSRWRIFREKMLALYLITFYFIIIMTILPLIFGFINYQLYNLPASKFAFLKWLAMVLTTIIIAFILIAIFTFISFFWSAKSILAIVGILVALFIPLSMMDMILQSSTAVATQVVANQNMNLQFNYAMYEKYYKNNAYIMNIIEQGEQQGNFDNYYQTELPKLLGVCGTIVYTPNNEIDFDNSLVGCQSDLTPLYNSLKNSPAQLDFVKLSFAYGNSFTYKIKNTNQKNNSASLLASIINLLNNYQQVMFLQSPLNQNILSDEQLNTAMNQYNLVLTLNSYLNPFKQWSLWYHEFSGITDNLNQIQGFPSLLYKFTYQKNSNGVYQISWNKTKPLINFALSNIVWILIGVSFTLGSYLVFKKRDIK
ncbi:ABC transporter permease [Spiroplasma sp. DGKH1]|uniref:ABC transporter permease n=1 Tax=Spiroplasma sp. DGKH1 TaxID=3050074 RepID=UPI0034C63EC9